MKEAGLDPKDKRRVLRTDDLAQALQEVGCARGACKWETDAQLLGTSRQRCHVHPSIRFGGGLPGRVGLRKGRALPADTKAD